MIVAALAVVVSTSVFGAEAFAAKKNTKQTQTKRSPYGVFLSIDNTEMSKLEGYDTVVIDAQYFTAEDITKLHNDGHKVFSYINIGSVENFREYYNDFKRLSLGEYENWEEELWVDTSDEKWQMMIDELAYEMYEKGVDGFWVDNCDVYYIAEEKDKDKIYDGLENMLGGLMDLNKEVIINSGDTFLDEYYERNGCIDDIITGINQETVFSSIDFDNETFGVQNSEDSSYYKSYITRYADKGAKIYLLEYTKSNTLKKKIDSYCKKNGFSYYVSDSIELDG